MRLASLVEPPFSGKKASGSVCAHSACSCQAEQGGLVVGQCRQEHRLAHLLSSGQISVGPGAVGAVPR
jgi:hypothetical protein